VRARTADAFDAVDADWMPVSPRLAVVRRAILCPLVAVVALAVAGVVLVTAGAAWALLPVVLGAVSDALVWAWVGRSVRSWAYAERGEDLLLRHGLLVRRLLVVPYGRMQFVDVTADPVHRLAGLATVQLHTGAATSAAVIRGLPPAEAARLRDRLAARGEARAAGL
jgi:membrane protein YdbS with pleckstrin-like domain